MTVPMARGHSLKKGLVMIMDFTDLKTYSSVTDQPISYHLHFTTALKFFQGTYDLGNDVYIWYNMFGITREGRKGYVHRYCIVFTEYSQSSLAKR